MMIVFGNFMGGLNNVKAPHLLDQTQAVVFKNVDNSAGTLKPTRKVLDVGLTEPYKRVYFNALIGTNQKVFTTSNLESQWGRYYDNSLVYYVNELNEIVSEPYGMGIRLVNSLTTTANSVSFDTIDRVSGKVWFNTVDSSGVKLSELIIKEDGTEVDAYTAWASDMIVVYALDTDGTPLTGRMKETANENMPYIISGTKYAYEYAENNVDYTAATFTNTFKVFYEPINFSIQYTKNNVSINVDFIDSAGLGIVPSKAVLENEIIVTVADNDNSPAITTGYAQGNLVPYLPFIYEGQKYTFSTNVPAGYLAATDFNTVVTYDDRDYDEIDYYTYAITMYNSKTGQETPPHIGSPTVIKPSVVGATLDVIFGPDTEGIYVNFDKVRIYRVSGPYTNFRFVEEVNYADSFTYVDTKLNDELTHIIPTANHWAKPTFDHIERHANRLFGYLGNTLYFTLSDSPYSWSELGTIYVEGDILAIATVSGGLLILTSANYAYILQGTNPNTFTLRTLSENTSYTGGITSANGVAYWVYGNNIYSSNGASIVNLTKNLFNLPEETIQSVAMYNDEMFLVYPSKIYQFVRRAIIEHSISGATNLIVSGDTVSYFKDGREYQLGKSTDVNTFEYLSPEIVGSVLGRQKEFKEVVVTSQGAVTIKLWLDGTRVTQQLVSSNSKEVFTLKLPSGYNKGSRLQVDLSGTGEVFEYIVYAVEASNG